MLYSLHYLKYSVVFSEPGSKWALQRAKFIIEHEFSVVGILNKMNETIQVLENYLPRFFAGKIKANRINYGKKGF